MADWVPKTRLGQMVLNGEITTMSDALATKLPLREPQIVDILLPDLKDEVIDLMRFQFITLGQGSDHLNIRDIRISRKNYLIRIVA